MELPSLNLGWSTLGLLVALLYGLYIFHMGQKRRKEWQFYALLSVPILATVLFAIFFENILASVFGIIVLVIFVVERVAWMFTLKEVAGEDRLVWFYLIFLVPLLGWLLYRSTSLR